jgi:hypothetical protein
MTFFFRILLILGALVILGGGIAIENTVRLKYMLEPLIVVLVLDFVLLLGFLTYPPRKLRTVFSGLVSRNQSPQKDENRYILSRMALYALASGFILSVVQVLARIDRFSQLPLNSESLSDLRIPLMTLLYGVLAAVGLWVVSGMDKVEGPTPSTEKNQVIAAFGIMLLTIGILSFLIIGINHVSGGGRDTVSVPEEAIHGLRQGEDMVWRPVRLDKHQSLITEDPIFSVSQDRAESADKPPAAPTSFASNAIAEPPLRWELNVEPGKTKTSYSPQASVQK